MPAEHDLQGFVDRLASRSRLTETERNAILSLPTRQLQVRANSDIVGLLERVDHVHVVAEGVVGRFGVTTEGERQITALFIAGDAPDLHSVVVPESNFPLQALSSATILRISHATLRALTARYPAIAEAFWRHCSVDAAIAAEWIVNLGARDAKTRIAHLLCEMAVRYSAEAPDGEVTFQFPLTQIHIGEATGLTPVHVNRTLKVLAAEGLVSVARGTVRIPDWANLADQGEFDPSYLHAALGQAERLRIVE